MARKARIAAIDAALIQHGAGRRVWIIDAAPSKEQRAYYYRRGAKLIPLTVTRSELAQRAALRPARNRELIAALTGINVQVGDSLA